MSNGISFLQFRPVETHSRILGSRPDQFDLFMTVNLFILRFILCFLSTFHLFPFKDPNIHCASKGHSQMICTGDRNEKGRDVHREESDSKRQR